VWIGAILLAWGSWKRGWWSPGRVPAYGAASLKAAYRVVRPPLDTGARWARRWLPWIHLCAAVLVLGFGLWWAGRLGWNFRGIMWLVTSLVVAAAEYHSGRAEARRRSGRDPSANYVRTAAFAAALGCARVVVGKARADP
jgi:hypothetical protein